MAVTTKSKNAQQVSSAKVLHAAVALVFTKKHMFFFIGTTGKKPWTYKGDISGFYFMVSRVILMVFILMVDIQMGYFLG